MPDMSDDLILVHASYAGRLWDAARFLDAEYMGQPPSSVPWAELSEQHKREFMHRTAHLIEPMLNAYSQTGTDDA